MSAYTERYHALKETGTCVSCKCRDAMPGATQCGSCAEKQVEEQMALRNGRKAAGKCFHCGRPPEPGFKTCAEWRQIQQEYRDRKRARRQPSILTIAA